MFCRNQTNSPKNRSALRQFRNTGLLPLWPYLIKVADTRTPQQRRQIMQAVKTTSTGPELAVRRLLFSLDYRFRLHRKDLPGRPDIVFSGRRKAIFIHGCYWHGHGCTKGQLPKSHLEYWGPKIAGNIARDKRNLADLSALGWESLVIWQCEIADSVALTARLRTFLDAPKIRSTNDGESSIG